ncbi:putative RNA-directed DNA polymerase from transposon X-element, partial [Schistosoma japonicum]
LKSYGVKDPLHSWFASFLEGRQQTVKYNNSLSLLKPITSGVIQGSVLGPLLFIIYINDIT